MDTVIVFFGASRRFKVRFSGSVGPGSVEPGADDFEGPAVDFVLVDGSQSQRSLGAGDCPGHMGRLERAQVKHQHS